MSFGIPSNPSLSDSLITKCFQKLHLTLTHIFNPATELAPLWIDKTTRKKILKKREKRLFPSHFSFVWQNICNRMRAGEEKPILFPQPLI